MASAKKQAVAEVIESEKKSSKSLFDRVAGFLDAADWHYDCVADKCFFDMRTCIKDAWIRVIVDTYEVVGWQRLSVYSICPTFVPDHYRATMLDAINRINYQMVYGSLEMDGKDGELRIRTVVEAEHDLVEVLMERALHSNLSTAKRYFAPLVALAFGNAVSEQVLDMSEHPEVSTLQ